MKFIWVELVTTSKLLAPPQSHIKAKPAVTGQGTKIHYICCGEILELTLSMALLEVKNFFGPNHTNFSVMYTAMKSRKINSNTALTCRILKDYMYMYVHHHNHIGISIGMFTLATHSSNSGAYPMQLIIRFVCVTHKASTPGLQCQWISCIIYAAASLTTYTHIHVSCHVHVLSLQHTHTYMRV